MSGVDRADRLEHAVDVGGGDQAVVGTGQGRELVADGSLEVAQDLVAVRIVFQAAGRAVEVSRKPLIGVLFEPELPDMSAQSDADRLVHGYLPSSSMSVVSEAQYARNSARWSRPRSVRR